MQHRITLCTGWEQMRRLIVSPRRMLPALRPSVADPQRKGVAVCSATPGRAEFCTTFPLPELGDTGHAFAATLRYLYDTCRCGVFVRIQNGRLVMFTPFVNPDFVNDWHMQLKWTVAGVECTFAEYIEAKAAATGVRERLLPAHNWWANAHILCNVMLPRLWGDAFLVEYHDMLTRLCLTRAVPDVEFFLNKRDFPQVRTDGAAPYAFLFSHPPEEPAHPQRRSFVPVLSGYTGPAYADVPFVTCADWEISGCDVDGASVGWDEKHSTAVFRGACTGFADASDNARIQVAQLSQQWGTVLDRADMLDAALTCWNVRDKVHSGGRVEFTPVDALRGSLRAGREFYLTHAQQIRYKYLLYIDGHSAANRLSFLLSSGCLVLRVDSSPSTTASTLWFMRALQPWVHYVPVQPTGDDLYRVITWCREHDEQCRAIAQRARAFWEAWLSREALLDYALHVLVSISTRPVVEDASAEVAPIGDVANRPAPHCPLAANARCVCPVCRETPAPPQEA
jgi:hypothetical protein